MTTNQIGAPSAAELRARACLVHELRQAGHDAAAAAVLADVAGILEAAVVKGVGA
jgi:hypothetical protein